MQRTPKAPYSWSLGYFYNNMWGWSITLPYLALLVWSATDPSWKSCCISACNTALDFLPTRVEADYRSCKDYYPNHELRLAYRSVCMLPVLGASQSIFIIQASNFKACPYHLIEYSAVVWLRGYNLLAVLTLIRSPSWKTERMFNSSSTVRRLWRNGNLLSINLREAAFTASRIRDQSMFRQGDQTLY